MKPKKDLRVRLISKKIFLGNERTVMKRVILVLTRHFSSSLTCLWRGSVGKKLSGQPSSYPMTGK